MRLDRAKRFFLTTVFAAALALTVGQAQADQAPASDAKDVFGRLIPSVAVRSHGVHVVPLVDRRVSAPDVRIVPAQRASHLVFEATSRRGVVEAANGGMNPVFLAGGSILSLDGEEHVIRSNHVLAPKSRTDVQALVLPTPARRAASGTTELISAIAPRYVRQRLDEGNAPRRSVRSFLRRFEPALATEPTAGERAPSFAAVDAALAKGAGLDDALPPSLRDPRAVGFATVLNGRVHSVEVFASHELMTALAPALLRAHTYKARALDSHGKSLGVLRPLPDDPIDAAREATRLVRTLLAEFGERARYRPDGRRATSWEIDGWKGVRGQVDVHGTKMVHAVLYPRAPYQRALYSRTIERQDPGSPEQSGIEELGRRQERGTTTEADDRRVNRSPLRRP